jgi:hypothetical protein
MSDAAGTAQTLRDRGRQAKRLNQQVTRQSAVLKLVHHLADKAGSRKFIHFLT